MSLPIARSMRAGPYASLEKEAIVRLRRKGWSWRRIAVALGRNGLAVGHHARTKLGLQ